MGMLEKMEWRRRGRWLCQYWEWQTKSHLFVWYFLLTNFNLWAHEESLNRVGTVWVNWIHRQWLWHKYFRGSFVFSELSHLCFLHCRSLLISCLQTKAVFPPKKVLLYCLSKVLGIILVWSQLFRSAVDWCFEDELAGLQSDVDVKKHIFCLAHH